MSWTRTQGGSFGMVPGFEAPMLFRVIALVDLDAVTLQRHLVDMVPFAKTWRTQIQAEVRAEAERSGESNLTRMLQPLRRV